LNASGRGGMGNEVFRKKNTTGKKKLKGGLPVNLKQGGGGIGCASLGSIMNEWVQRDVTMGGGRAEV